MNWKALTSSQNLNLAWRRINTGKNISYKRFFREHYLAYEAASKDNIRVLREQLLAKAWIPSYPDKIYVPKPSGLQRPITLMGIEDQIVFQALANIYAKKLKSRRQEVEYKSVFSNTLSRFEDPIFFLEPWQTSYSGFTQRCEILFNQGNVWIGNFDLAAYYNTISHDLLLQLVAPTQAYRQGTIIVRDWLKVWGAIGIKSLTTHGLPQGPIASDFLADAFFLPIDLALRKKRIKYVRYVDDIRIFAKSREEAARASVFLEKLCTERGLIIQGQKYSITKAETLDEALGSLPSIPPSEEEDEPVEMPESEALQYLQDAVGGKPLRVQDKTHFRFVMFRAGKSPKVLKKVLTLLPRHPEHIDAIVAYLGNYAKSKPVVMAVSKILLTNTPYTYYRGELWHLLARLADDTQLRQMLKRGRRDAKERHECVAYSWGVMHYLIQCDSRGIGRLGTRLHSENDLSLSLLAPVLPERAFADDDIVRRMLRGAVAQQLTGARELQRRGLTLNAVGLKRADLSPVCQNTLRAFGVIKRASRKDRDWVGGESIPCSEYRFRKSGVDSWALNTNTLTKS